MGTEIAKFAMIAEAVAQRASSYPEKAHIVLTQV
jgi:hypothetical protein